MEKKEINTDKKFITDQKSILYLTPLLTDNHKSLKDQHFTKYYNNIFQKISKANNLKTILLTEKSLSKFKKRDKKLINIIGNDTIINKRHFKDPKNINYKLLKYNPYATHYKSKTNNISNNNENNINENIDENIDDNKIRNNRRINVDETLNKDVNMITLYNIKFNRNKKQINTDTNNNIDRERKKIINKVKINILHKEECTDILNKIKLYHAHQKKRRIKTKKYYDNNVREGFFGKKDTIGVPYVYDNYAIYKNEYANKSEKNRHETMLNEIYKLKTYLNRHPDKKLNLIKDFLCKFHLDEIEKYNDTQFLNLCDFITNANNSTISNTLKPYLNIKNMVYDFLNNSIDFNNLYSEENNIKQNNNNNNYTFNNKDNNDYQEIVNNINYNTSRENYLTRTFYNETPKDSTINEQQYYLSPLISRKPSNYFSHSLNIKRKNYNNNKTEVEKDALDLDSTNSKLKYMIYQKKSFFPSKTYSNNNIIVNEIGKEIRDMENDYNKKLKELEIKISEKKNNNMISSKPKTFNIETKDKLYISIKNNNNTRLKTFVPIHYKFTKNFKGKMKNFNDINNNTNELLKSDNNNIYRERFMSFDGVCLNNINNKKNREKKINNNKKDNSKSMKDRTQILKTEANAVKRLYYIPTRKKFGLQEIRNRLKLTEYIVLTHAKNNIYKNKIKQIINNM